MADAFVVQDERLQSCAYRFMLPTVQFAYWQCRSEQKPKLANRKSPILGWLCSGFVCHSNSFFPSSCLFFGVFGATSFCIRSEPLLRPRKLFWNHFPAEPLRAPNWPHCLIRDNRDRGPQLFIALLDDQVVDHVGVWGPGNASGVDYRALLAEVGGTHYLHYERN